MAKTETLIRRCALALCAAFTLATVAHLLMLRDFGSSLLLASFTLVLICLPRAVEKLFSCHFRLPVYLFCLIYTLGPMLGHCWKLYYILPGWDKLLHCSGGILFAMVGFVIFRRFTDDSPRSVPMAAIFALCFSMALSVAWEFFEFGSDMLFGTDMQMDTLVTQIHSYFLSDQMGVVGSVSDISQVVIDGQALDVVGYIDIGLIDTMGDMLIETAGALAACAVYFFSGGRLCGFEITKKKEV